ncbi:hypothetical protein, partial [Nocardia sp. NPDC004711]
HHDQLEPDAEHHIGNTNDDSAPEIVIPNDAQQVWVAGGGRASAGGGLDGGGGGYGEKGSPTVSRFLPTLSIAPRP